MYKAGIIGKSKSSWSFPLVPVLKKDGTVRPCADLRQLNTISRWEAHPLPHLSDCITALKGSKYFTCLDLNKGFMQLWLDEESSNKCSFPFNGTLWRFLRVPFGLKSAPGWFQCQMQAVLSGLGPEELLIYIDDFLIHSPDIDSHLITLEKVLSRLQQYGLKIKPEKCNILKTEVSYLGHRITPSGITPLESSVNNIKNFPRPTSCREVRRAIGMANWYREYAPNFSNIIKPLTQSMAKKSFSWTPECEAAFEEMKTLFSSDMVLAYPDYRSENPLILTCDASAAGAGGYLSQMQEGKERIISYYSKSFSECQSRYSAFDKELESIRLNLVHFKPHILGKTVVIRTDHKPISELAKNKHISTRLHRIYELLDTFDIQIEYVPGKVNVISDYLSRIHENEEKPREKEPVILPENKLEYLIPGGGDSLFKAIALGLYNDTERHQEIRNKLCSSLKSKPVLFGINSEILKSREFKRLSLIGEPAISEHIPNLANIFNIRIIMHQSGTLPITYNINGTKDVHIINKDNIHFNGVITQSETVACMYAESEVRISPNISKNTLITWQANSESLLAIKRAKETNKEMAGVNDEVKPYLKLWDKIIIKEGLLTFQVLRNDEILFVPLVPEEKINNLISQVHEGLNHIGRNKTFEYMRTYFFFKNMRERIGDELKNCLQCKMYKTNIDRNNAPFKKIYTSEPYEKLCIDLAEMPKSSRGHKYILVAVDHYSKWAICVPLKNKEGATLANVLEKIVLPSCHNLPQSILSDNGGEFKNHNVSRVLKKYSIEKCFSPAFFPQNNGLAERTISTIKTLIRTSKGDWEQNLASTVIAYNHNFHEGIGMSPAEVFTSRTARVIIPDKNLDDTESFEPYKVGDKVLRKIPTTTKMGRKYDPGYIISRVNASKRTYGVLKESDSSYPETKVHHNQIILHEEGLPHEGNIQHIPNYDSNLQRLKELAKMTIKPNWNFVTTKNTPTTTNEVLQDDTNTTVSSMHTATENNFVGFPETNNFQDRLRRSCRPKKPVERYDSSNNQ